LHGQVSLLLQAQHHLGVAGGLHLAVERFTAGVECLVVVEGHHASSVTRSTSSIVVSPASALAMPSSYIVRMPDWRAICSSSPMPAWRITARRSSSFITRNSMIVVRP